MPKPKSKRQARLFGFVAGGGRVTRKGRRIDLKRSEARERLRGVKVSRLPN